MLRALFSAAAHSPAFQKVLCKVFVSDVQVYRQQSLNAYLNGLSSKMGG